MVGISNALLAMDERAQVKTILSSIIADCQIAVTLLDQFDLKDAEIKLRTAKLIHRIANKGVLTVNARRLAEATGEQVLSNAEGQE